VNIPLLTVVNNMLASLPEKTRVIVYKTLKWVAFAAVLGLLVVLNDTTLGFDVPANVEKIVTAVVAFFASMGLFGAGSLADANTPSSGEVVEDDDDFDGHADF